MHHMRNMSNYDFSEIPEISEVPGPIAVNSCSIALSRTDIMLLSDVALILYKAGLGAGVQDVHIKFALLAGTYSIDDFNVKVKEAFLQ